MSIAVSPDGPVDQGRLTTALEVGDWPSVLVADLRRMTAGDQSAASLVVIQRTVAVSMRHQAEGRVWDAFRLLDDAARRLPRALRRFVPATGRCLGVLGPPPPVDKKVELWTWATARVIVREQHGLIEHERLGGVSTPRDALVAAYVEHLRWIECDPFSHVDTTAVRAVPFGAGGTALLHRATELRRLTAPKAGDISVAAWRSVGRHRGLRAAALRHLAENSCVPAFGGGALPDHLPVRRGRVAAHRLACNWCADCVY